MVSHVAQRGLRICAVKFLPFWIFSLAEEESAVENLVENVSSPILPLTSEVGRGSVST